MSLAIFSSKEAPKFCSRRWLRHRRADVALEPQDGPSNRSSFFMSLSLIYHYDVKQPAAKFPGPVFVFGRVSHERVVLFIFPRPHKSCRLDSPSSPFFPNFRIFQIKMAELQMACARRSYT